YKINKVSMVRVPVVAGQFYPSDFHELEEEIKRCFTNKRGPGALPINKRQGKILGAIAPHAGYVYSGACAAWVYKEIGEAEFPDLFIIIGPNHTGLGRSSIMLDDWQTPFGLVKCDKDFAKLLAQKSDLVLDSRAHMMEHSIEVQLPFLQFVSKDHLRELRFVPIVVSQELNIKRFILDLKEVILESGKNVCLIASSDFTHYGPAYGYLPFELEREKRLYELDSGAIKLIKEQNVEGFYEYLQRTGATICGYLGIAIVMGTLPKCSVKCLQYYTSGDVTGDYRNAVGYAAIVFK
ncbi:AmmeMemoRadiSam system protein B, partial [Candidatus Woesearchaeota archaeon]